uniref:C-type lectin domain-containing protein n=1 Tax=Acrobeloides nanus TaxID=290746 RepID=A0A914DVR3_9BILA
MLACIICLIFLVEVANGQTFPVFVNSSNPIRSVPTRFLSIGWDMYESVPADFYGFDFSYYWDNTATLDDVFQNTSLFDAWYEVVYEAKKLTNWFHSIWCGECSTMTGGGAKGISDRFASGFLWLDKLGIAATYGLDVVIRHALWGDSGFYALLNTTNFQPKPDYWLSFLYKKLVGTDVLRVTVNSASGPITTPQNQSLRLYAASSASGNGFVLYGLNIYSCLENGLIIDLPDVNNKQITAYVLTGYNDDNLGLASRYASLNNALLNWTSHQPTPNIQGQVASLPFTVPPYSLFFLVVNQTQVTQCPAGWYQVPNTNKCINVFQANQPWFGANFNCSLYGQNASLLSIQNDTEAYYVHQLTLGTSCSQSFIGLLSNNNGSNWTWSNGDSSTYQLWQTGYPVNDNTKNCVAFDKNAGKFYNVDCDQPRCYICQLYI